MEGQKPKMFLDGGRSPPQLRPSPPNLGPSPARPGSPPPSTAPSPQAGGIGGSKVKSFVIRLLSIVFFGLGLSPEESSFLFIAFRFSFSSFSYSFVEQSWNRVHFSEPDPTRTRRSSTRTRSVYKCRYSINRGFLLSGFFALSGIFASFENYF